MLIFQKGDKVRNPVPYITPKIKAKYKVKTIRNARKVWENNRKKSSTLLIIKEKSKRQNDFLRTHHHRF